MTQLYIDTLNLDEMSEEECGVLYVADLFEEEKPEPDIPDVLFDDPSPPLYDDNGLEDDLNELIELQERMATGMKLIKECNETLSQFNRGLPVPYGTFMAWVNRRKLLWTHWWKLKDECSALVGERTYLWSKYFQLVNMEFHPYWSTSDAEAIDNQYAEEFLITPYESLSNSLISELQERYKEDKPLHKSEEAGNKTGGYVPICYNLTEVHQASEGLQQQIEEYLANEGSSS